jgi:hypothetical protein
MPKCLPPPKVSEVLSDPILDVILAHARLSRDDLYRVIDEARRTLARVPRQWHVGPPRIDKYLGAALISGKML